MIKLEKIRVLITENSHNLDVYRIIEISLILHCAHIVFRDQDKVMFYVNNYINWNLFNQLHDSDKIEKSIKNADIVVHKFGPPLISATYQRLKVAKEER